MKPRRVVEVRYKEITEDGLLRAPVFLRFRDDKPPGDCARPGSPPAAPEERESREVVPSNLEKVFWPEEGFTKGDLLAYYRAIAPWLLPYLRDRPVVLTRFPDGIAGKSFFQKDAPDYVPAWIRTARMKNDEGRDIDHFVCDDAETLLYVVNLGTIPLHVYAGRADAPHQADWTVIDLDPKSAPFEWVIRLAQALHELCEEIGLPSFCKTSGQAGLHVLLPLAPRCTHEQARDLALVLANVVEREHKDIATLVRAPIEARRGRVYLDCYQNGYGKTIAAPFSARPVPGATVSMPLRWSEVKSGLDPRAFTIETAPRRMRKLKRDPLAGTRGRRGESARAPGQEAAWMSCDSRPARIAWTGCCCVRLGHGCSTFSRTALARTCATRSCSGSRRRWAKLVSRRSDFSFPTRKPAAAAPTTPPSCEGRFEPR